MAAEGEGGAEVPQLRRHARELASAALNFRALKGVVDEDGIVGPNAPPHLELDAPQVRSGRVLDRTGTARVEGTRRSDRVPEPRRITGRRNAERAPPVRNGRLDRVGPNRVEFRIAVECRDPVVQLRERWSAESAAVDELEVHVLGQREHGREARAHAAAQIREVIEAQRAGQRDLVGGREAVLGEGGEDVAALVRAEARGDRRDERQARAEVVVRLAIEVEGRLAAQPQARREMVLVLAVIDSAFDAVAPGVQGLVGRDAVGEDRFAAVRRRHLETGGSGCRNWLIWFCVQVAVTRSVPTLSTARFQPRLPWIWR